jgi:prefoldin subunit 5
VLVDGITRIDRQVATLRAKITRLESMIQAAAERRLHLERHLAEIDADGDVTTHRKAPR